MRALLWASRIVLFLFLFAFAIKNTDPVGVRFFLGHHLAGTSGDRLAGFFAAGAALAVLSLLGSVFGLRREVAKLKRELKEKAGSLVIAISGSPGGLNLSGRPR
jgi:putative membrane protein